MTLEQLLADHGLDEDHADELVSWARDRTSALLAELDPDDGLRELLVAGARVDSDATAATPRAQPLSRARPDGPPVAVTADDDSIDIDIDLGDGTDDDEDGGRPAESELETDPGGADEDIEEIDELDLEDAELEMIDEDVVEQSGTHAPPPPPPRKHPSGEDDEPDLLALAENAENEDTSDRPPDEDPAVAALVASLDDEDD